MRLIVTSEIAKNSVFILEEGDNLLGRWDPNSSAFPEIDLEDLDPDARVSRKHAIIDCSSGRAWLRDLGSLNGTSLNGHKLEDGDSPELFSGDTIQIGKLTMQFESRAQGRPITEALATRSGDEE